MRTLGSSQWTMSALRPIQGRRGQTQGHFPPVLFGVSFALGDRCASKSILSFRYAERVILPENFFHH